MYIKTKKKKKKKINIRHLYTNKLICLHQVPTAY